MDKKKVDKAFKVLSKELPPAKKMASDKIWEYKDVGWKVFEDDKDRDQFIWALISVATQNGIVELDDFKLLYSRRGENDERIIARLVAIKDGIIKAKIEPQGDGKDQAEAFRAFRRGVEVQLERILRSVPGGSSSMAGEGSDTDSLVTLEDEPPAYNGRHVGMTEPKP